MATTGETALAVGLTALVVGGGVYFWLKPKTAAAASLPPTGGSWAPATQLVQGKIYRISANVREALGTQGVTLFSDKDPIPGDWPKDDLAANRYRAQGTWTQPTMAIPPLPADVQSVVGLKVYQQGG